MKKFLSILAASFLILSQLELSVLAKPEPKATNPHASTKITNSSKETPRPTPKGKKGADNLPTNNIKGAAAVESGGRGGAGDSSVNFQLLFGISTQVIQSVQNDPFTGRLNLSVPIITPPGRRGIQPKVSLSYTSTQANSIAGIGWNLSLPNISRSTKKGRPKYNDTDIFILEQDGSSQELVSIGNNQYRPKIEGSFTKFVFQNNSWELTDKSGTKYRLGFNADSKQADANVGTFRWCIDKAQDLFGNYMEFTYVSDQNQIYPATITYTKNDSERALLLNTVEFVLEDRPDANINYRSGIKVITAKRISQISAKCNGELVRRYQLVYEQSALNNQSLLTSVRQYGSDGQAELPPVTFAYQENQTSFNAITPWNGVQGDATFSLPKATISGITYADIFDINGDGLPDRVTSDFALQPNHFNVQLNNGRGFNAFQPWNGVANGPIRQNDNLRDLTCSVDIFDINGDGLPDRVMRPGLQQANSWSVQLNNGRGFDPIQQWNGVQSQDYWQSLPRSVMSGMTYADCFDINGDGLPDRVTSDFALQPNHFNVQINNGNGFDAPVEWSGVANGPIRQSESPVSLNYSVDIFDINGDGLPDRVIRPGMQQLDRWDVQLNNGQGFDPIQSWNGVQSRDYWQSLPRSVMGNMTYADYLDINGDGLIDRITMGFGGPYNQFNTQINNGQAFNSVIAWSGLQGGHNENDFNWRAIRTADGDLSGIADCFDINGDGLPDRVMRSFNIPCNNYDVQLNSGPMPNLLSSVSNGLGGQTQIEYVSSVQFDNCDENGKPGMSSHMPVVSSVTSNDGRGNTYTTRYSYKGGKYDYTDREFRGFREVTVTDPQSNYTKTYFHQDAILKGKPHKAETYDSQNNLLTKSESVWQSRDLGQGANFPYLTQSDNFIYGANHQDFKRTRTTYTYDDYGNQTQVSSLGDINVQGDEKIVNAEYVYNQNLNILSTAKHSILLDSQNQKVSESWVYYDNHNSVDDAPTQGLATKQESWLKNPISNQEKRINSRAAYNNLGLSLSTIDPLNRTTSQTYDSDFKQFPITVTNPKNQIVRSTYDYKTGQVLTVIDPNNQTTRNIYDNLGRLIKVVGPLDTEQNPGIIYEYYLDQFPAKVVKKAKIAQLDNFDANNYLVVVSFYDGLGRLIQTKTVAQNDLQGNPRFIISDTVTFDQNGRTRQKFVPYFSGDPQENFSEPNLNQPHITIDYDALGRITRTTNPDNTFSTIAYDGFNRILTDENNNPITYINDAYGRLSEVVENYSNSITNEHATYRTHYFYNTKDSLVKITDSKNNQTSITYDTLGRKIAMSDPDMGNWSYEYDDVGNLTRQTDAKGQILNFHYDELNRLTERLLNQQSLATYIYDDVQKENCIGRLSRVTYPEGSSEFFYDVLGREIRSVKTTSDQAYTIERTFNALNQLKTLKYPDNTTLTYTYDSKTGQIIGISSGATQYINSVRYSQTGQIESITYGNGDVRTYTYNPQTLRLEHLVSNNSANQRLQDLTYSFDNVGNITQITDAVHTNTQSFTYDSLNRLIHAQGASYGTIDYKYDSIGNLTRKIEQPLEGAAQTINYNCGLQRNTPEGAHVGPHAVYAASNGDSFTYDNNGNATEKYLSSTSQSSVYEYDSQNRLIKTSLMQNVGQRANKYVANNLSPALANRTPVYDFSKKLPKIKRKQVKAVKLSDSFNRFNCAIEPSLLSETTFEYDPDGGRIKKTFANGQEPPTTNTYVGNLYEIESSGHSQDTIKYIFLGSNRICLVSNNFMNNPPISTKYFHADHLGSSNLISDQAGNLAQYLEYQPYGTTSHSEGSNVTDYKFTGKELDSTTGLYYYGSRYYDPTLCRFTQPDTIVPKYDDPQSLNRYSYCRNNPLRHTDPTGHYAETPFDWMSLMTSMDEFKSNPGVLSGIAVVLDVVGVAGPGSIGAGFILKGGRQLLSHLDDIGKATRLLDKAGDTGKAAGLVDEAREVGKAVANNVGDVAKTTSRLPENIAATFKKSNYKSFTLENDVTAYRVSGGKSTVEGASEGIFLTTGKYTKSSTVAKESLSLPPWNKADQLTEVSIPKGTEIHVGRAESLFNQRGGGTQIFVKEKSNLVFRGTKEME